MMLIAFHTSQTLHTKGHSGSEKKILNFHSKILLSKAPIWIKVLCNGCIICKLDKPYPTQKQIAEKRDFKGKSLYFNHRNSFDTKGPISTSSEVNSFIKVIVDALHTTYHLTQYTIAMPITHTRHFMNTG